MKNNPSVPEPSSQLLERAALARRSATKLAQLTDTKRRDALISMSSALKQRSEEILRANLMDIERSESEGLSKSLVSRLLLSQEKLDGAIKGVMQVAQLSDPIGIRQVRRELSEGLLLERLTVPLGVLGVIFEARPDAVMQISSLAIRSGNGALLKGGSEARCTNEAIIVALQEGLANSDVDPNSLALLTTRKESLGLLRLDGLVDLIIPRGSNELVQFIQENTRIPVLGHADGICHLYVDSDVDIDKALRIAIDSKTQYPAACNAIESLLIHEDIADAFLKVALPGFREVGVELRGDEKSCSYGVSKLAVKEDWGTEYLDLVLSVKIVSSIEEALDHIREYGSRHTEAIATNNSSNAKRFLSSVDSSGVFHNCSTRFADGFRYGFGAEVGISTQTMPPRGPVGLEGLVTYRYFLYGDGHIVSDFVCGEKNFLHRDL